MDFWENELDELDASVARIPGRGVEVTVYASGDIPMFEAAEKMASAVGHVVHARLVGAEIVSEVEWERRANAPTMPELMSAAEIAEELGITRQRVHQLRSLSSFPAPLADLRGGAVWDAAAVRRFGETWERRPGRPRTVVISPRSIASAERVGVPKVIVEARKGGWTVTRGRANSREVVPNADGGWDVKKPGASRASAHVETQAQAVDRARQILRNDGGGELRVHGRDGRIRNSDTIPPGNDPYPPKG
ncbi:MULTISPECIES: DUF2188 domain-containing protein [unclassified Mycobacterium]|uniref:DUF2188 domain-containing protein n=1 Tax=unclassified Mycobacterium TaxID=2642494 RepID=UPI00336C2FCD